MKNLLWVAQTDVFGPRSYEVTAAKRQHVMVNYLDKRQTDTPSEPWPRLRLAPKDPKAAKARLSATAKVTKRSTARRTKTQPQSAVLDHTAPSAVLIPESDRVVYRAAWFHAFQASYHLPCSQLNWRDRARIEFNDNFWDFAQADETLLEIFLAYAAAKEATVQGCGACPLFYMHLVKALSLIQRDVNQEGNQLRFTAVAAIGLLSKAAFAQGDYISAESHRSAVVTVIKDRIKHLPIFIWLCIVWTDLCLTAVGSTAPALPFWIHPTFSVPFPSALKARAEAQAIQHASELPLHFRQGLVKGSQGPHGAFTPRKACLLLERLYGLTAGYDEESMDDRVAWRLSYEIAYSLAELESELQRTRCVGSTCDCDLVHLAIIGARIQFWAMSAAFVPQDGVQEHLLAQFMAQVGSTTSSALYERWARNASPSSLLWAVSNVCSIAIRQSNLGQQPRTKTLEWLSSLLGMLLEGLGISSYASFDEELAKWPSTMSWNELYRPSLYDWAIRGHLEAGNLGATDWVFRSRFADLRLTFDPAEDRRVHDRLRAA